jgi:hypothetical protein
MTPGVTGIYALLNPHACAKRSTAREITTGFASLGCGCAAMAMTFAARRAAIMRGMLPGLSASFFAELLQDAHR